MTIHVRHSAYLAAAVLLLTLAGCDNNGHDKLLSSGTANEIAVRQIEKATCDEKTPQDLTDVTVRESDEAVDIDRVDPDCS